MSLYRIQWLIRVTQLFESLRKQSDPKKLEKEAKAIAEREAAHNAKAQQRLAELVSQARLKGTCVLIKTPDRQQFDSPGYHLFDSGDRW